MNQTLGKSLFDMVTKKHTLINISQLFFNFSRHENYMEGF